MFTIVSTVASPNNKAINENIPYIINFKTSIEFTLNASTMIVTLNINAINRFELSFVCEVKKPAKNLKNLFIILYIFDVNHCC